MYDITYAMYGRMLLTPIIVVNIPMNALPLVAMNAMNIFIIAQPYIIVTSVK